jgi:hypothetical protein
VGDFVAVADQGFTNEHGHGETPREVVPHSAVRV